MAIHRVTIGDAVIGGGTLAVIAGPCVIESEALCLQVAEHARQECARRQMPYIFKASFDKANRTALDSRRGPGLDEGLRILHSVRERVGVPVLTDIHEAAQAAVVAQAVDALQIPAFLCRQTELLQAAGSTGKPVNIKKGQFLAPEDMKNVVAKLREGGCKNLMLTERGVTFGYGALVVDFRSFPVMRSFGFPVVFDGTHSVQRPGGLGDRSGGDRREVPGLVRGAVAVGVDGLFLEVHEDPDRAPSDGPNMLVLDTLPALLERVQRIRRAAHA